MVPNMCLTIIDRAVQVHGAGGVCQDTPLANMWAHIRTLRIADGKHTHETSSSSSQGPNHTPIILMPISGPDEAHLQQIGKNESRKRAQEIKARFARQKQTEAEIFRKMGLTKNELGAQKFSSKL